MGVVYYLPLILKHYHMRRPTSTYIQMETDHCFDGSIYALPGISSDSKGGAAGSVPCIDGPAEWSLLFMVINVGLGLIMLTS